MRLITREEVRIQLSRLNIRKAMGPDNISPRLLKVCAGQLDGVLQHLFNLSLRLQKVPTLWKTSCIVPVPKHQRPSVPNDYRPVALTSHVMKVFERLVLEQLKPMVNGLLDPLQFAYRAGVGVDDAIIHLLHRAYTHLEKAGGTVRIMFFDFSSAFNTISPLQLADKLTAMQVDGDLVAWITDYLTGRPQYVRLTDGQSEVLISNTGAPQGTALAPFLFILDTNDFCYNTESCFLQKYSDDSTIGALIKDDDEVEYRGLIKNFVKWAEESNLRLNASKTKELVVDFRKPRDPPRPPPAPVFINKVEVEMVDSYKYLGLYMNKKLDWSDNTDALYKKGQSRLFFLRRLRSFDVCSRLLRMFYQSVVASAIFSAVACWGSGAGEGEKNRLNKLVEKASSVVGGELVSLEEVANGRIRAKLRSIMGNPSHPLYSELTQLKSTHSKRLRQLSGHTSRFRNSFVPAAIKLYNEGL